jgi:hypothetical protein
MELERERRPGEELDERRELAGEQVRRTTRPFRVAHINFHAGDVIAE